MQKNAPSVGRILTMVVFALSCFGLLMFLWLSFGGPLPLQPEGYRFQVAFSEAATLAQESDVRLAGVNVGRVKTLELDKGGARTIATLELDDRYAPIPEDTRAILRQKTLLGETYVELTPGNPESGMLAEGGTLGSSNVEQVTQLDEIQRIFDPETRRAFRAWVAEQAVAIDRGTGRDLNDALGNLPEFSDSGADVLEVLDSQEPALRRVIRNTGRVFAALNEEDQALQSLIVNSNDTFGAIASEQRALAETIQIFPTFLRESRLTLDRLQQFSVDTNPLVDDLKPVADDLGPTVADLGDLSPDLSQLYRDFRPLIASSADTLPEAVRFLDGAEPVFEGLHTFLPELNPILAFGNYNRGMLADFIQVGGHALNFGLDDPDAPAPIHALPQSGLLGSNSNDFAVTEQREFVRANSYLQPRLPLPDSVDVGAIPSFDCANTGGPQPRPTVDPAEPPCAVVGDYGYGSGQYPLLRGLMDPLPGSGQVLQPDPIPSRPGQALDP